MDDLISRQALIDAFDAIDWYHQNRCKDMISGANPDEHQAWYKADDVYKALEQTPSAQRTGEWIHDGSDWTNRWICSQCGNKQFLDKTNYCPNCGADMRGGDSDE